MMNRVTPLLDLRLYRAFVKMNRDDWERQTDRERDIKRKKEREGARKDIG